MRTPQPALRTSRARAGFSLVEVAVALGIISFALVAIFALIPVGLTSSQTAIAQTGANDILSAVFTDLRATPPTAPVGQSATTQRFQIPIPAAAATTSPASAIFYFDSEGQAKSYVQANSRYRLSVAFLPNTNARAATLAFLKVTWPALADPANAAGSVTMFAAFDRN